MHGSVLAHRIETTVAVDGTLVLDQIPFHAGDNVEVIILRSDTPRSSRDLRPLLGAPVEYLQPFDAVAENTWNASR